MQIYKGKQYIISANGLTAEKSDGVNVRSMKYYPERDIAAIAGEIDELSAWQILLDISCNADNRSTPISPDHIFIDGNKFILSEWSESSDHRFIAPEGYSPVWALAATVFYVFLGCHVFHGLGGRGQTSTTPIPTLRKEHPELSNLIIRCLDFNPANRPEMTEIGKIASENISRCRLSQSEFPPLKDIIENNADADTIESYWPEEMC